MIRNIIFDVGKVLVSYEPEQMMKNLGYTDEQIQVVKSAMFDNPLWDESDRGIRTMEEYHEGFLKNNLEQKDIIQKAYEHIGDAIELFPYAIEWILKMKKRGYRVYILSNYSEYTFEVTKKKLVFLQLMDGIVFSYEARVGKPDAGIYKKLINEYSLEEKESVFIDDRRENIEAAEKLGIKGIHFLNYEQARDELELYLKANNGM